MDNTILVGFGDSWTFGSELDRPTEQNWLHHLSLKLGCSTINMSSPASGIEHTVVQLFNFIKQSEFTGKKKIFAVGLSGLTRYLTYSNRLNEFVNITPEAVYRTTGLRPNGNPPETVPEFDKMAGEMYRMVECLEHSKFLLDKTIFLFDNYCKLNNIDVIYFSYFDFLQPTVVCNMYPMSITRALTGQEYTLPDIRAHEYFAGKLFHPNKEGHIRIAELLKEFYDQQYPGN